MKLPSALPVGIIACLGVFPLFLADLAKTSCRGMHWACCNASCIWDERVEEGVFDCQRGWLREDTDARYTGSRGKDAIDASVLEAPWREMCS